MANMILVGKLVVKTRNTYQYDLKSYDLILGITTLVHNLSVSYGSISFTSLVSWCYSMLR